MNKSLPTFVPVSLFLTEIAAMYNWHLFFFSTETNGYGYIDLWPWLLLSLAAYGVVHSFLRRPRELMQVVILGGVCCLVTTLVMSLAFIHVTGTSAWVTSLIGVIFCSIRGTMHALHGCEPQGVQLGCELPLIGMALMLWLHEGGVYQLPPYGVVTTLAILFFNFLALVIVRMHGSGTQTHQRPWRSGGVLVTLAVCFAGLLALASAFTQFASGFAARTVSQTSNAILWLWTWVTDGINRFFAWLASLFPPAEAVPYEMEAMDMTMLEEMETMGEADYTALIIAGIGIAIAIIGALIWLVYQFRKLKMGRLHQRIGYKRPHQSVDKQSIWKRLRTFFLVKYHAFVFEWTVFFKRNTPQGAVLTLAKIGKTRGAGQQPGESYGHYIARLAQLCHGHAPQVEPSMMRLGAILDEALYSDQPPKQTLCVGDYRAMRKAVSKLQRIKAKKKSASLGDSSVLRTSE